jgi:FlaA1/EpsC-like NDP-sugar epimerase
MLFSAAEFERGAAVPWHFVLAVGLLAAALHLCVGWAVRLPHGRAALGTLDEMILLGGVAGSVGMMVTLVAFVIHTPMSIAVPIGATCFSLVAMGWARALYRRLHQPPLRRGETTKTPAVVLGAGDAGRQLIASMLRQESEWVPVALLDDCVSRAHLRIRGIPVLGTSEQMAQVSRRVGAQTVIVAIPSVSSARLREFTRRATDAGLELKVLPATNELLRSEVGISDLRDLDVADLLGRRQIDTDIGAVAGYLTHQRVLVTGAGGSIGSEICRQVAHFQPDELIMLDRDESALHAVQLSIYGRAMLDSDDVVLGDIRDTKFINNLFAQRRPHVVFHAAALKHLPMLEQYPGEAVKTNVWGTLDILEAAAACGVEKFVNISTDKAANPTSVLGYSKRVGEALTAAVAPRGDGTYLSVRFGNVLGSRGSVLTAFAAQIAAGGPLTVTHPDVTRYFMTVQEAVQLVIQAAAIGHDGEALVLDMGRPVSIDSVARQLIDLSGKRVDIVYTGLRDGEKLHEELLGNGEPDSRPVHPLVSHIPVPALNPRTVRDLDPWASHVEVTRTLEALCECLASEMTGMAS